MSSFLISPVESEVPALMPTVFYFLESENPALVLSVL